MASKFCVSCMAFRAAPVYHLGGFLVFFCSSAVARIHCSCLCSIWPQLSSACCVLNCKQTCYHVRVLQRCWVPSRHCKLGYGLEIAGHRCLLMR